MQPLPQTFFARDAVTLARALIGCVLVHDTPQGRVAGRIVETEAYDQDEPAAHSYRGITERTRVMFGAPGHAYVYFSYGVHWCMNIVAAEEGRGAAVLLRALEPLLGIEQMAKRRGMADDDQRLARGPGCLTQALAIDKSHNGNALWTPPLFVAEGAPLVVEVTERIGISKAVDLPWRFIAKGSPFVSRARSSTRTG